MLGNTMGTAKIEKIKITGRKRLRGKQPLNLLAVVGRLVA